MMANIKNLAKNIINDYSIAMSFLRRSSAFFTQKYRSNFNTWIFDG